MKSILSTICLLLSFSVFARESKIAVITSDYDKNVTEYFLETNSRNHVDSLRYITKMPNGGIYEDISLPAERVLQETVVIVNREGRDAVFLSLEKFTVEKGGTLVLTYLYNGVTGTRRVKKIELRLVGTEFQLFDNGKRINRMFLVSNRSILGIIGVKEIQTSFK